VISQHTEFWNRFNGFLLAATVIFLLRKTVENGYLDFEEAVVDRAKATV